MSDIARLTRLISHDPADPSLRNPTGAMPAGTAVALGLLAIGNAVETVSGVALEVLGTAEGRRRIPMAPSHPPQVHAGRAVLWNATLALPAEPCALRYRFVLVTVDSRTVVYAPSSDGRSLTGEAFGTAAGSPDGAVPANSRGETLDEELGWFQVTVYDPSFSTPDWMHGAVMYQVFPDRFARVGPNPAPRLPAGASNHAHMGRPVLFHRDWNEAPDWHDPGPVPDTGWDGRYDPVDFFGGTLQGIASKLDYLVDLGVGALYLNPVFEARSNHRYDTADYSRIDPLLGSDEDFEHLCAEANRRGIRVVLDAVLSHTGDDSVYFNAAGTYPAPGAAQGETSPYYQWYDFEHPNGDLVGYRCWWGEPTLPEVDEENPAWQRFMLGEGGILDSWLRRGASGYRLDVADELPDDVLEKVRAAVKRADPDAAVIGEVWEDPTTKVSYGRPRTYALGRALDSVMNYPLREALIGFALGTVDAHRLAAFLTHQRLDYPPQLHASLMNLLGSHDVERLRTVLALGGTIKQLSRIEQLEAVERISPDADERAARLQALLAAITYLLPGMPTVYYGDELGLQGGADPFCRASMPWDAEARRDRGRDLLETYRALGALRRDMPVLRNGEVRALAPDDDVVCIVRLPDGTGSRLPAIALCNRGESAARVSVDLSEDASGACSQIDSSSWESLRAAIVDAEGLRSLPCIRPVVEAGVLLCDVPPQSCLLFIERL